MRCGTIDIGLTFIFQFINTILLLGFVFLIYYLVVKMPRRGKERDKKIEILEKKIDDINEKLNK